jgi:hypothetical protein
MSHQNLSPCALPESGRFGSRHWEKVPHQAGLGSQTTVVHTVDKTESGLGGILLKDS